MELIAEIINERISMKLRTRVLLYMSLTLVGLAIGVYFFSSRMLSQSYANLEHQNAVDNIDRARLALLQSAKDLHERSVDWASRDDSYRFMADRNQAFVKSNFEPQQLTLMKVDVMLFVDVHGKLFYPVAIKRLPNLPPPNAQEMWRALHLDRPGLNSKASILGYSGLILHSHCPLMVSVRPILTSKSDGPTRGWLVFGRYFDLGQVRKIAEQTRMDLETFPLNSPSLTPEDKKLLNSLTVASPLFVKPKNSDVISGFALISDTFNHPALLMKMTQPRAIYKQGEDSARIFMGIIFLSSAIFSIVLTFLLESSVLRRVTKLTKQVDLIGSEGEIGKRVSIPGADELTRLANRINEMLQKVESSSQKLSESKEELRLQNENLEFAVKERTEDLMHQAFHDSLTGLPNRNFVLDHLARLSKSLQNSGCAVIFLDLDNFKFINDSLGHAIGDELLICVAERLKNCVRHGDIVARLGGDEFIIVLEALADIESAKRFSADVLKVMNAEFYLKTGEGYITASMGVAFTDSFSFDPDILIRDADTAMYYAKSSGKAKYAIFEPAMNDRMSERIDMDSGLRRGLERKEFCVYYQPMIDLKTGRLIGAEALVRWNHPTFGIMLPGKFIPLAEETGLIVSLGYWVLEEACRQAVEWKRTFPEISSFIMSVNLSGKQLAKPDVVEKVKDILHRTNLTGSELKLEITESVFMDDMEATVAKLSKLRALGVKLALDDFGTGYSSIAALGSFPIDTLKIDRAFVNRIGARSEAVSVVAAIILIARSLHIDVTGEGIETTDQMTILQDLGCDIGQGFLFSRPISAGLIEEMLSSWDDSFVKNHSECDLRLIHKFLEDPERPKANPLSKAA